MEPRFISRQQVWRRPGRPATPPSPALLRLINHSVSSREACVIATAGEDPHAVRALLAELRRAGRQLELRIRVQCQPGQIVFIAEEYP